MAEGKNNYTVVLSILDKMSAPILGLDEKLKILGHTGEETAHKLSPRPSEKLWSELSEHVENAKEKFGELGEHISEMGERLADILPMLGAVGGVASFAGILELAHATAEASEALADMSKITGVAVPQLQQVEYAAKQVGVPMDQMSEGFERLNVSIARAATGQDKQSASLFKAMGISLVDAKGHVKNLTDILPQLESSFSKTKDPALRAAMAMQLFGRSGEEMMPLLAAGSEKLAEYQNQFSKFGYTFSSQDQDGLEQFNEAWKESELSMQSFANEVGAKLAPIMAPLLTDFALFVAQNREWISLDVERAVSQVSKSFENINLHTVISEVEHFVGDVEKVVDIIGGMQNAMIVAGGVIVASFLAPVIELTTALIGLGTSMAVGVAGPVVEMGLSFIKLIPEIKNVRDVMAALDIIMDANPIGAMVLAAAAAGVAVYELWDHWKGFKDGIVSIWHEIDAEFHKVFDPIGKTIDDLSNKISQVEDYLTGSGAAPTPAGATNSGAAAPAPVSGPLARFGFRPGAVQPGSDGALLLPPPATGNAGGSDMSQTVTIINPVPGSYVEHRGRGGAPLPVVKQDVGVNGLSRSR